MKSINDNSALSEVYADVGVRRVSELSEPGEELEVGPREAPRAAYGTTRLRSPRLSRADVIAAADAVLLAGGRVTIDRVRAHLGRGSPNTIQEHLEVWWGSLGSRLRDIPGREFPELPEEVARALQGLWNTALDAAHAALGEKIDLREAALTQREAQIALRETKFADLAQSAAARAAALEQSVALARAQLQAGNQRAEGLEASLAAREAEYERLRMRHDAAQADASELRRKLEAAAAAHQAERTRLDERHAANEARWLVEVDRARQGAKEAAKDHEREVRELRSQLNELQTQREELKQDLNESRAELRSALALRAQAEKRLGAHHVKSGKARRPTKPKPRALPETNQRSQGVTPGKRRR